MTVVPQEFVHSLAVSASNIQSGLYILARISGSFLITGFMKLAEICRESTNMAASEAVDAEPEIRKISIDLDEQSKRICANVYETLLKTRSDKIVDIISLACSLTGVSKETMEEIIQKEEEQTLRTKSPTVSKTKIETEIDIKEEPLQIESKYKFNVEKKVKITVKEESNDCTEQDTLIDVKPEEFSHTEILKLKEEFKTDTNEDEDFGMEEQMTYTESDDDFIDSTKNETDQPVFEFIDTNCMPKEQKLPTLEYFTDLLATTYFSYPKACVGSWLNRLGIEYTDHDRNPSSSSSSSSSSESICDPNVARLLQKFNQNFYLNYPNSSGKKSRKRKRKSEESIPTLDYFYKRVNKSRYLCSKSTIERWLKLLEINFDATCNSKELKTNRKSNEKLSTPIVRLLIQLERSYYKNQQATPRSPDLKPTTKPLPTLEYFRNRLKQSKYTCSVSSIKHWLDLLCIDYDMTECDLLPHKSNQKLSRAVMKLLIRFNNEYGNNCTQHKLVDTLERLDEEYKAKGEIPSLKSIQEFVSTSATSFGKDRLKEWLGVLKINFSEEIQEKEIESDDFYREDSLPSLDYFYKKVNEKSFVCSKSTLKSWLGLLTIKYELIDCIIEENCKRTEQDLSSYIINQLVNWEEDYNRNKQTFLVLVENIKNLDKRFRNHDEIPLLNCIHRYATDLKLFKNYAKTKLARLLPKLDINYKTEESIDADRSVKYLYNLPSLEYFHEKLPSNYYSKADVYKWLKEIGIPFKNDNLYLNKRGIESLTPLVKKTLQDLDRKHALQNLTKRLQYLNKNNQPLTFDYLYQIVGKYNVFESKEENKFPMKMWLRDLAITFEDNAPLDYYFGKITNVCSKKTLASWLKQIGVKFKENQEYNNDRTTGGSVSLQPDLIQTLWKLSKYQSLWDVEYIFKRIETESASRNYLPSLKYLQNKLVEVKSYCNQFFLKDWLNFLGIKFKIERENGDDEIEADIDKALNIKPIYNIENLLSMNIPMKEVIEIKDNPIVSTSSEVTIVENETKSKKLKKPPPRTQKRVRKAPPPPVPGDVMALLSEIEYDFYKIGRVPTLEHFNEAVRNKFDIRYSKETVKIWLTNAGIKFICKTKIRK